MKRSSLFVFFKSRDGVAELCRSRLATVLAASAALREAAVACAASPCAPVLTLEQQQQQRPRRCLKAA
eukprot:6178294-Pleurochrysis_carterae.AAC.1